MTIIFKRCSLAIMMLGMWSQVSASDMSDATIYRDYARLATKLIIDKECARKSRNNWLLVSGGCMTAAAAFGTGAVMSLLVAAAHNTTDQQKNYAMVGMLAGGALAYGCVYASGVALIPAGYYEKVKPFLLNRKFTNEIEKLRKQTN